MTEFLTWDNIATYAGALAVVVGVTQLLKGVSFIQKIPTQIFSYFIAIVALFLGYYFTGKLTTDSAVLILVNGVFVSLGANGGFEVLNKVLPSVFKKGE